MSSEKQEENDSTCSSEHSTTVRVCIYPTLLFNDTDTPIWRGSLAYPPPILISKLPTMDPPQQCVDLGQKNCRNCKYNRDVLCKLCKISKLECTSALIQSKKDLVVPCCNCYFIITAAKGLLKYDGEKGTCSKEFSLSEDEMCTRCAISDRCSLYKSAKVLKQKGII